MAKFALNTIKYEDIRNQIIDYLNEKNEFSGQFDFAGSNLSYFIDVMSYVTTFMSYNTSHVANNIFLDTSEIRKNVVSLAHQIGYYPQRPYPASFQGKLIYRGSNFNANSKVIIKPNSPFFSVNGNIYSNKNAINLIYQGNPTELIGDYYITEGIFYNFQSENTTNRENFSFLINNKNASDYNFSLYVLPKSLAESESFDVNLLENYSDYLWDNCSNALSTNDKIYFLSEDITKEGFMKVSFGNGVIGRIPSNNEVIICRYIETKGSTSNSDVLSSLPEFSKDLSGNYLYYDISFLDLINRNSFGVINFDNNYKNAYNKSFGGKDLESIDGIKFNAPKKYSSSKIITKNDYLYFINTYSEIKHANVIGGDELYHNNDQKLGNIYITAVPNFDDNSFLYSQNLYLMDEFISKMSQDLNKISVISTNKIFQNPTYIFVDITPNIEINTYSNESVASISNQVLSYLLAYVNDKFDELGVKFRESKISSSIQGISGLLSAYLELNYFFVINYETVKTSSFNQSLYLPIINVKDSIGQITGTTNFVKTISQIIKEDIVTDVDWTTNNISNVSILNYNILNIKPEQSSLYAKLIHPNLDRFLYNRDYNEHNILSINFGSSEDLKFYDGIYDYNSSINYYDTNIYYRTSNFIDINGIQISISIESSGLQYFITFTKYNSITNLNETYRVAELIIRYNPNIIYTYITQEYSFNLLTYFGIEQSNYVFNNSPFYVERISDIHFKIFVRHITNDSYLCIDGKNTIFSVYTSQIDTVNETLLYNFNKTSWVMEHSAPDVYATLKYGADEVAHLERSHSQLISSNKKFKGFISTLSEYDNIYSNRLSYSEGDYFIVSQFFSKYTLAAHLFFNKNDVLFVNNEKDIVKSEIKGYVSADSESNLITNYEQGDLYIYDSGYIMFDKTSINITHPNFTELTIIDSTKTLDASKFLPKNLTNNKVVRISIPDEIYSTTGYFVYYYDGITHKLQKPLYVKNSSGIWEEITTKKVYDGDIIVYKETNDIHVNGGWYLLENITDPLVYVNANARISIKAIDIITIDYLSDLKSFLKVVKIVNDVIIESSQFVMFDNPPEDAFIYEGTYLICIDEVNNKWVIFDDDPYEYQFDIINNNTEFPEPLQYGYTYNVDVSDSNISNFRGMTLTTTFTQNEKIVYYDENSWKKFVEPSVNYNDLPSDQATIGDLIKVTSETGNFNNSNLIDAPKFDGNYLFSYNDMLYYTGTHWIKVFPHNIYNNMEYNSQYYVYKKLLNDLGYNSDFGIKYSNTTSFDIILPDLYDGSVIGKFDYYTGQLQFFVQISKKLNQLNTEYTSIENLFHYNNYENQSIKIDRIKIKQVNKNTNEVETDFDTMYCQYIVCNVSEPKLK